MALLPPLGWGWPCSQASLPFALPLLFASELSNVLLLTLPKINENAVHPHEWQKPLTVTKLRLTDFWCVPAQKGCLLSAGHLICTTMGVWFPTNPISQQIHVETSETSPNPVFSEQKEGCGYGPGRWEVWPWGGLQAQCVLPMEASSVFVSFLAEMQVKNSWGGW